MSMKITRAVSAFALSLLITAAPIAHAIAADTMPTVSYHKEFVGTQAEFIAAMKDSIHRDPKGNARLNEAVCRKTGDDCITLLEMQNTLREQHPELNLPVEFAGEAFVAYVASAQAKLWSYATPVESSREAVTSSGKSSIDVHGEERRYVHPGEMVYAVIKDWNGKPISEAVAIFLGACWNIIKTPKVAEVPVTAEVKCGVVHAFARAHERLVMMPMLTDGESFDYHNDCWKGLHFCETDCGNADAERQVDAYFSDRFHYHIVRKDGRAYVGVIADTVEGDNTFSVPPGYVVTICREHADAVYKAQSIVRASYKDGNAWILRSPADKPGEHYVVFWKKQG